MCLHPLSKPNPNFTKGVALSRFFNTFPCGKCAECNEQRILQWQVRGFHEFVHTKAHGGYTYFVTLTYNRKYLPIATFIDSNGQPYTVSTWNGNHIKNFFKRVRIALEREYGTHVTVRYLLTCERGSKDLYKDDYGHVRRATFRPHYHAIITFNAPRLPLTYAEGYNLLQRSWSFYDPVKHTRQRYGKLYNEQLHRTPEQAIRYVCKYVVKNQQTDNLSRILPYFLEHNQGLLDGKDILPRLHVSKFYGINAKFNALLFNQYGRPSTYYETALVPNPWDTNGSMPSIPLPHYYTHHYEGRMSRNYRDDAGILHRKYYRKTLDRVPLSRHRGGLIDGTYVDPYQQIEDPTKYKPIKQLFNQLHEDVQQTRLTALCDKRLAHLRHFAHNYPTKTVPYQANKYLDEELIADYTLRVDALRSRVGDVLPLLGSPLIMKYLSYIYTHFPQSRPSIAHEKHLERVRLLDEFNQACTVYQNMQNACRRMLNDEHYRMMLPQMMQQHPELFEQRILE